MRLGTVIGRVTLSQQDPALKGSRFLLVQPLSREQFLPDAGSALVRGNTVIVYDSLGPSQNQIIGFVEGAEATAPFPQPTPVDAYNALIVDRLFYSPPN